MGTFFSYFYECKDSGGGPKIIRLVEQWKSHVKLIGKNRYPYEVFLGSNKHGIPDPTVFSMLRCATFGLIEVKISTKNSGINRSIEQNCRNRITKTEPFLSVVVTAA